jgi:hypothetical protein
MRERIILGRWTKEELDDLLKESSALNDIGRKIDFLSRQFLGVEYKGSTLIGSAETPEVFVIDLEGVDCFTFIDYIEAMRVSRSFAGFREHLTKVRYRSGDIAYEARNHFFTDWREFNPDMVNDITKDISAGKSRQVKKILNRKDDKSYLLPGIPCREREIAYIPSEAINDAVIENLRTGDYTGIYSEQDGLDVSHAGIVIKDKDSVFFRHASTKSMRVVDEDFRKYLSGKPGIIVLRPK